MLLVEKSIKLATQSVRIVHRRTVVVCKQCLMTLDICPQFKVLCDDFFF